MSKEWPPQNTGLFAPPACASCCTGQPPEEEAGVSFVDVYPNLDGLSYQIFFTPSARDSQTGIVGTGYIRFTKQAMGDLPDCSGCYGVSCGDDENGQPLGSASGYLQTTYTQDTEFYVYSNSEHGTATNLSLTTSSPWRMWSHQTTMGQNAPNCADPESFWDTIAHTFVW